MRVLLVVVVALTLAAQMADASCITRKCGYQHRDPVAAARASLQAECDCTGSSSARDYKRCVRAKLGGFTELPAPCARAIVACEARSTCGRPERVVCCTRRRDVSGKVDGTIERKAARCKGSICDAFMHASDACDGSTETGCAPR